jgi:NADPH:quinone reductase-like Zn-dependent oxidoreductase
MHGYGFSNILVGRIVRSIGHSWSTSMKTSTMNAVIATAPRGPLEIRHLPVPPIEPHEVLVRVIASGVNPLDVKIWSGKHPQSHHSLPAILGVDVAGEVVRVGSQVTAFKVGDAVYGMTGGVAGVPGTLSQFTAADARLLAHKPANISMRQAASLPLVYITAWEGVVDRAKVSADHRVLVLGSGGVGLAAIQLAKAAGAQVFATGSGDRVRTIDELGATPIDVGKENPADIAAAFADEPGFDIVYDTIGGPSLDTAFTLVKRFGHVVSSLGWGSHGLAPLSLRAATYSGVFTLLPLLTGVGREHHGDILREVSRLAEQGKVIPLVDPRHFSLSEVGLAYDLIEQHTARGKIVIDVG